MSNAMPHTDGITHIYDCADYIEGATSWANQSSGGNLIVTGGSIDSVTNSVFLPASTGYAYCPYDIGNNCTVYALVKGDPTTAFSGISWGVAVVGSSSNYRAFMGQTSTNNKWNFYAPYSTPAVSSASDWHVIAMSVANGSQKFFIDGVEVATSATTQNFNLKGLYINNGAYNGGSLSGTSTYSANMYFKYIALATTNHSADQIADNSAWINVHCGMKSELQLGGTEAVAMAYVMAFNKLSADMLQACKKAYHDGLEDNASSKDDPNSGGGAVVVVTEIMDDVTDVSPKDKDTNDTAYEFGRGGVYIKTGEITVDGVTGIFQLHVEIEPCHIVTQQSWQGENITTARLKLTLTGNGISKSEYSGSLDYDAWEGVTAYGYSSINDGRGNEYYMVEATLSKSYGGITGILWWRYINGTQSRNFKFYGDYATALQSGTTLSTLPFSDVI